ncbi:hypothetical protein AYO44_16570 [Planctomycetaceae bacterium SCGC AG-212-F19]|nr:hypothetical protein AYO44_16570 [Planctomycetaceae bacterium SCGC AG-212-F19]
MAVGKRSMRRITVEGHTFHWRCAFNEPLEKFSVSFAKNGETWSPDCLLIRPGEGPHRLLTVTWPACHGPVVKPRLVRTCVLEGLRRGWLIEHPEMTMAGRDVPLPN